MRTTPTVALTLIGLEHVQLAGFDAAVAQFSGVPADNRWVNLAYPTDMSGAKIAFLPEASMPCAEFRVLSLVDRI